MRRAGSHGTGLVSKGHNAGKSPPAVESSRGRSNVVAGVIVYGCLVVIAFIAGLLVPSSHHVVQPVPHTKRTHCTEEPEPFDASKVKGKKVLVTGAAGFIGSHVARQCSEELDIEVIGIDDYGQGAGNIPFLPDIHIIRGDLRNSSFLSGIFGKHQFDVIFHAAEVSSMAISHHFPSRIYDFNVVGTANLVTQAVKAQTPKFVLLSSTAVYGRAPGPWAETTETRPADPYGISKLAAEHHLRSAADHFGLDYIILRIHSVYGPLMDFEPSRSTLVARAVASAITGMPVTIHGKGLQRRQFTFVEDVARLITQAAFLPSGAFHVVNLGSNSLASVADVVEEVEAAAGKQLDVQHWPFQGDVLHVQAVHDRSICMFDFKPTTSLREGIKKTLEWATDADIDLRPQHHQFYAEIRDDGSGLLETTLGTEIQVIEADYGAANKDHTAHWVSSDLDETVSQTKSWSTGLDA